MGEHPVTAWARGAVEGTLERPVNRMLRYAAERHLRDLEHGHERGLYFDEGKANRAMGIFPFLKQRKGRWAGTPLELSDVQKFLVGSLFGWMRADGTRRFRVAFVDVPRKFGKALALDTPIPTPTGWTTMGELEAGDLVFDEQGNVTRVVAVSEVFIGHDCYRLRFSNGEEVIADAGHLWVTTARVTNPGTAAVYPRVPEPMTRARTTEEIHRTLRFGKRGDTNHSLLMPEPLHLEAVRLPVDPWVLGAWLGDGHSAGARVTVGGQDLAEMDALFAAGGEPMSKHPWGGTVTTGIGVTGRGIPGDLNSRLRALGVLNNKHIPASYLRASFEQRLALLQGLMDTDGYVMMNGLSCEFTTTSPALADGMGELLASLGLKFSRGAKAMRCNGRDVEGTCHMFRFAAFADMPVFRLARKRVRLRERPKTRTRSRTVQIVACEPVESVPTRCIAVASPGHQFRFGRTMLPTHNSTLAAGVADFLAFFDGEPGSEVYCTATKKDQARIVWDEAKWQLSNADPKFKKGGGYIVQAHSIYNPTTSSRLLYIGADKDGTDGLNPHGIVADEIHAWKSEEFLGKLETAAGARTQPMRFMITTAGTQTSTLYLAERAYAESVVKGTYDDDSWFVFISCADDPDKWQDEEQWYLAHPHLGVTVSIEFMRDEYKRAAASPSKQSMFKRMYLGIITSSAESWLMAETLDEQPAYEESVIEPGRRAVVGVDLASVRDIAAVVWWFPDDDADGGDLITRFYVPRERLQARVEQDRVPYDAWEEAGWITATPGREIDYDFIEDEFKAMAEEYEVASVAIDQWQAIQFRSHLDAAGFQVVKVPQSHVHLDACVKEAERLLSLGNVRGINPVMRWMMLNAVVNTNNRGERKLDKQASPEKIDGAVAWVMALSEAMALVEDSEVGVGWA